MTVPETRPTRLDRVLGGIERAGNKLPEPFVLFALLLLLVAVVSTAMAAAGVVITIPGDDGPTAVRGAFTGEGVAFLFTGLAENFIGFPPLAVVVTIMLGVGLAERTGMLAALIRLAFANAPRSALPYALGFVGVSGSVMSDSAFIVVPPLAAIVFKAAGRHPVAGLIGGFAAAGAGYSTSLFVTSLDALFAGITNGVAATLPDPGTTVTPVSNYLFNAVSAVVLSLIAGFVIARIVEPSLEREDFPRDEVESGGEDVRADVTVEERRGLRVAGLALLLVVAGVLLLVLVVLASALNPFIVSGSSLWTLMASVFVPLFLLLGYEPAFIQAAFRVGDSATQVMTPLNPYMIVLLTFVRRYRPEAGLGTVIAKMVPFVVPFWIAWVLILTLFYVLDLPLGPGGGIRLTP